MECILPCDTFRAYETLRPRDAKWQYDSTGIGSKLDTSLSRTYPDRPTAPRVFAIPLPNCLPQHPC